MGTPKRKYTQNELYEMRTILHGMLPTTLPDRSMVSLLIEARLQTCLLNGTTLEEDVEAASVAMDIDLLAGKYDDF